MAASFNKFQFFVQDIGQKIHNLNSDVLKDMLTNTVPVNTNHWKTDITDIGAGFGYTAGGTQILSNAYTQSGGTATLSGGNVVFTAVGGAIGPFRYVVCYNSTPGTGYLIGWWDYASSITLNAGETFTVDHTANILTIT